MGTSVLATVLILSIALCASSSSSSSGNTTTTTRTTANFSFPSFPAGSCGGGGAGRLTCMHNSSVRDGYIAVTREEDEGGGNGTDPNLLVNNFGRVMYRWPVITWPASFTTYFTVLILKGYNATGFGDGMSFVMTTDLRPSPPRSYGGFLGLFDQSTTGNTTGQLAVEIDTFQNEFDPDGNHVGVDIASIVSNATASLSSVGVDPKTGKAVTLRIQYDGWAKKLEVWAGHSPPLRSVLNYTIVLAKGIAPVYVGFTAGTGPSTTYRESHRVLSWNFSSITLPPSSLEDTPRGSGKDNRVGTVVVAVVVAAVGATLVVVLGWLGRRRVREWKRRRELEAMSRSAANAPKMYTYTQLARATRNFSSANLIGKGGFGSVYSGHLSSDPAHSSTVAVKKMSANSKQGEREYFSEICTIGRLRHRNIVQLQGWCHSGKSLLLVYEFMPNGSLDRHIGTGALDWPTRHRILLGLASALLYLHDECGGTVVHRDVKPNNVLLDADFHAHLGDFGLARLLHTADRTTTTTILAGTIGYLAPECGYTGKATPESDVFSYGVVVLEVLCGRRSLLGYDDNNLLDHVWDLFTDDGDLLRAMDPKLEGRFQEHEARRCLLTGLLCAHPTPSYRPRIRKVLNILANPDEPLMPIPESRPDTIVASPMGSGFHGLSTTTSSSHPMTTTTMLPPPSSSPDYNSASTVLIAR